MRFELVNDVNRSPVNKVQTRVCGIEVQCH